MITFPFYFFEELIVQVPGIRWDEKFHVLTAIKVKWFKRTVTDKSVGFTVISRIEIDIDMLPESAIYRTLLRTINNLVFINYLKIFRGPSGFNFLVPMQK